MKCLECEYSNGKQRGLVCPASRITPIGFTAGCALGKPRQGPIVPEATKSPRPKVERPAKVKQDKVPNHTELEYARKYLAGMDYRYEAESLKMANGHSYTGDWAVYENGKLVEIHECKGGWAFGSQQRSRLAFDQCRIEFPHIRFVWAKKSKKGWKIKK